MVRHDHDFEGAALNLREKADFRPLFPKPVPNSTEFETGLHT
jgi:hypothetical protein